MAQSTPAPRTSTREAIKAVIFVLFTLGLWFVFSLIAQAIVSAVPQVDSCIANHGLWGCLQNGWSHPAPDPQLRGDRTASDWVILIIALLAALWAASRAVFPPEDFNTPDSTGSQDAR